MTVECLQESKVYCDHDMSQAVIHALPCGVAAVFSARCPGHETSNEDAAAVIPINGSATVIAVADGMGGMRGGEQASRTAIRALKSHLEKGEREGMELRTAILNGIESANKAVADLGCGAATTLAVVEVRDGMVRPYHVGDSLILVVGQRGKIKLQTIAHSPIGFAVEAGLLNEAEAMHHEDRHLVSNVMGAADMRIEVGSALDLAPRDTVLVASDGLADNLHVEEIVQRLCKGSIEAAAERLADDSRRRMNQPVEGQPSKPDDLTFIAFRPLQKAG